MLRGHIQSSKVKSAVFFLTNYYISYYEAWEKRILSWSSIQSLIGLVVAHPRTRIKWAVEKEQVLPTPPSNQPMQLLPNSCYQITVLVVRLFSNPSWPWVRALKLWMTTSLDICLACFLPSCLFNPSYCFYVCVISYESNDRFCGGLARWRNRERKSGIWMKIPTPWSSSQSHWPILLLPTTHI